MRFKYLGYNVTGFRHAQSCDNMYKALKMSVFPSSDREKFGNYTNLSLWGIFSTLIFIKSNKNIISEFANNSVNVHNNINQFEVYKFLKDLNTYIEKINCDQKQGQIKLKPSDDFVKVQVLFGMLHGVILKLCDGKYVQMANNVLNELFNPTNKDE